MARHRSRHVREEGSLPTASARVAAFSNGAHIKRIEAAMSKIARALPSNASLGSVWERLEGMHLEAVRERAIETEIQERARAWLKDQKYCFPEDPTDRPATNKRHSVRS